MNRSGPSYFSRAPPDLATLGHKPSQYCLLLRSWSRDYQGQPAVLQRHPGGEALREVHVMSMSSRWWSDGGAGDFRQHADSRHLLGEDEMCAKPLRRLTVKRTVGGES